MHTDSARTDALPSIQEDPNLDAARRSEAALAEHHDLDVVKSATVALLCHDVRGGLCVVAGFLDMAAEDLAELLDEQTLETLLGASRQMDRIMSLLQDLGNYSHMQPPGSPGCATVPLGEIIAEMHPALEAQFAPQGLAFDIALDPDAEICCVHSDLVGLAIRSLVGAFGRLDPAPATVSLHARRSAGNLVLEIARPAHQPWTDLQERILQSFARGAATTQPQTGGLALGNWIARRAVELLHGDLRMHCDPKGDVRFVIELPLAAPADMVLT